MVCLGSDKHAGRFESHMQLPQELPHKVTEQPTSKTSIYKQGELIYMRGAMEDSFKDNLDKPVDYFMDTGATLYVTDPGVPCPIKLIVKFTAMDLD